MGSVAQEQDAALLEFVRHAWFGMPLGDLDDFHLEAGLSDCLVHGNPAAFAAELSGPFQHENKHARLTASNEVVPSGAEVNEDVMLA